MTESWWSEVRNSLHLACADDLNALDRGQSTYRPDLESFEVDDKTINDIDLNTLVLPLYQNFATTELGRLRLAGMIRYTADSAAEAQLRRDAVRELEQDDALRSVVESLLVSMTQMGLRVPAAYMRWSPIGRPRILPRITRVRYPSDRALFLALNGRGQIVMQQAIPGDRLPRAI